MALRLKVTTGESQAISFDKLAAFVDEARAAGMDPAAYVKNGSNSAAVGGHIYELTIECDLDAAEARRPSHGVRAVV